MIGRIVQWWDERTGFFTWLRRQTDIDLPSGPSWGLAIGFALIVTLMLEAVTGIALSTAYAPSATDAWGSVYFIQYQLTGGELLRGLHHFGSHALVLICVLHLCRMVAVGAYRAPREVFWLSGLVLLALILAAARTGHLLPYDQKAYWSTRVPTNIAGSVPLIGGMLKTLTQGGSDFGTFTLTRFYGLHVGVLPLLILLVATGHWGLYRKHGAAPTASTPTAAMSKLSGSMQQLLNWGLALLVVAVLFAVVAVMGVTLEAPADPSSQYEARPEWYYLSLFHLLKWFEGPLYVVGTVIIPGVTITFIALLPWLDRGSVIGRRITVIGGTAILLAVVTLSGLALAEDANSETYQTASQTVARNAAEAVRYAGDTTWGIDVSGRVVLYEGKKVFRREQCAQCHDLRGEETKAVSAPSLDGYLSREWLHRLIKNPNHDKHFGLTKLKYDEEEGTGMEGYESLGEPALSELVEYVASLAGARYEPPIDREMAGRGAALFDDECSGCHDIEGDASVGPHMQGYGGMAWLTEMIRDPTHERYYGELGDKMPKYNHLSGSDMQSLAAWLMQLRFEGRISE